MADSELAPRILETGAYLAHPTATVGQNVEIGPGAKLYAGATIGAGTHIGSATVIGANVQIGEFCTIGDGVAVEEGVAIAGSVKIGAGSQLVDGYRVHADTPEIPARIEIGFGATLGGNVRIKCNQKARFVRVGAFATVASASKTVSSALRPFGLYDGNEQAGWVDPFGIIISRNPNKVPAFVQLTDELDAALARDASLTPERRQEFRRQVSMAYDQLHR